MLNPTRVNRFKSFLIVAVIGCLWSCAKEDPAVIDLGYDYFPNKAGSYVIYAVDSTVYNSEQSIFSYQLKEVVSEEFVDDTGEPAVRVECFVRHFQTQPWILRSVCVQKRGSTNAERIINNQRTIILEFPMAEGGTWNGNAYNDRGPVTFKYSRLAKPVDIGILEFSNTVTVLQENINNLVNQRISREIYAKNVGNIYRYQKNTETQNNVTVGYEVEYAAISYGFE
jgi:hypothetical protein